MTKATTYTTTNNPWFIGYDDLFNRLNTFGGEAATTTYPPYNIIKADDNHFIIEVAAAGFKRSDLTVSLEDGCLFVRGLKEKTEAGAGQEYVYRGLATRSFTRKFVLAEDVHVRSVNFEDGILIVSLDRVIPEHKKPRTFEIK